MSQQSMILFKLFPYLCPYFLRLYLPQVNVDSMLLTKKNHILLNVKYSKLFSELSLHVSLEVLSTNNLEKFIVLPRNITLNLIIIKKIILKERRITKILRRTMKIKMKKVILITQQVRKTNIPTSKESFHKSQAKPPMNARLSMVTKTLVIQIVPAHGV